MSVDDFNSDGDHSNTALLLIRDVTYGYSTSIPVLEGISLDVEKGEIIGLLGPNGSGKSTLLKIIAGLIRPWSGSVRFNVKQRRPVIGYMPRVESIDWNFPVTVEEVVAMGLWNRSGMMLWSNRHARERVYRILEYLNIERYAKRQIRELSGGEQQRVFLARAIVHEPELLLLDEPTSSADNTTREDVLNLLKELGRRGITIILATHDIGGVAERLPRVICLYKRVLADGKPSDILTHGNLLRIYGFDTSKLR